MAAPLAMPDRPPSDGVVTLRPWSSDDVPELVAVFRDPTLSRWLPMIPHPYRERDAREWLVNLGPRLRDGSGAHFAVVEAETGALLGGIGLRPEPSSRGEIGYWVREERRGEGIASRALRLISRWAFEELGLARLQVHADVENVASQRVAERAGYRREGVLRSWIEHLGERRDHVLYSLLATD